MRAGARASLHPRPPPASHAYAPTRAPKNFIHVHHSHEVKSVRKSVSLSLSLARAHAPSALHPPPEQSPDVFFILFELHRSPACIESSNLYFICVRTSLHVRVECAENHKSHRLCNQCSLLSGRSIWVSSTKFAESILVLECVIEKYIFLMLNFKN